jgi:hypothetical protein
MVWRIAHNKKIPRGYNIHHLNENKRDDRIENLEIIKAIPHMQEHYGKVHNIVYKKKSWWRKIWDYQHKNALIMRNILKLGVIVA